ncbi:FAD-dependent oxidoreductase [Paenibacillus sp. sgz302251]|uniref:FAD-dependent oxidoreductase n=1 Tax=Paenibacillus sp. sgz302251 TaxID=3414493 RepID=UPI003C7AD99D
MNKFTDHYDVAVLGGGPAGIVAALAAARSGARTILVERYGFLGGMSTLALVYPWMTFHSYSGEQVIHGIAQEIVDNLMKQNASPGHLRDTIGFVYSVTPYEQEAYKVLAFDMLQESGVELLLHAIVTGVETDAGRISGIVLHSKSGQLTIRASVYIDATGDGDVAYHAGAPWEKGNEDAKVQPMTMKFRMKGVQLNQIKEYMKQSPDQFYNKSLISQLDELPLTGVMGFYKQWKQAGLPIPRDGVLFFAGPREDEVLINISRVSGLDPNLIEDLTLAEIEGRRQVMMLEKFFQESIPGFQQAYVSQVGTQIGIRESRRIIGEYVLTGTDVLNATKFNDVIARSGYPVDIHNPEGEGITANFIKEGGAYDIPYRCIVAKNVNNLLLAGRCISTTHEAQATTRLTPSCMALGQAAGTAAAIAVKQQYNTADVPIGKLQEMLLEGKANLGLAKMPN